LHPVTITATATIIATTSSLLTRAFFITIPFQGF
jgi:hypothetical protein